MRTSKQVQMLHAIRSDWELCSHQIETSAPSQKVIEAMRRVPRDEFVPDKMRARAFDNNALPIGEGQTISQPFIVALMTDLLNLSTDHHVLEVGAGSGYQAAVLAEMVSHVYTIEVVQSLAEGAATQLERLGYDNVKVRCGDGYRGWPEFAPYDAILVAATAPHVPNSLKEQLRPGGRMVIPVGMPYQHQELMLYEKDLDGNFSARTMLGVAFVPLTGEGASSSA
ncbi:MAG: protein-L-isoaspartate(D-aspartate) O-methyltransferase [Desulfuromonadaceae bacterium]